MGDVIGAGELHKGVKLLIDGEPWEITEFDFSKPGKGQAIYNCKLRNMITGGGMSRSYRSGDKFERPELLATSSSVPSCCSGRSRIPTTTARRTCSRTRTSRRSA